MGGYSNDLGYKIFDADGRVKHLVNQLCYDKIIFNHYTYKKRNNEVPLIIASYPLNKKVQDLRSLCISDTPELLLKMIELRNRLSDSIFSDLVFKCDISKKELKLICDWCSNNGYPFHLDDEDDVKAKPLHKELAPKEKTRSFYASDFLKKLDMIYNAYKIMYDHIQDDEIIINPKQEEECLDKLKEIVNAPQYDGTITYNNGFVFHIKAKDIFDAALFQLLNLTNLQINKIRICKLCGKAFIAKGKREYCDALNKKGEKTCYPQKYYKQNKAKGTKQK